MTDGLLARARSLWEQVAEAPVPFPCSGGVVIAVSAASGLCPPAWAGIVRLGDAALITVPDETEALLCRRALVDTPVESLMRPSTLRALLPVVDVLGPAALAYLSKDDFRAQFGGAEVGCLPPGHEGLRALAELVGPEDAAESGIDEADSPVFVVRNAPEVVAAAGYRRWPASTAHLCVLTAPQRRGHGLARQVASGAVAHALDAGLLPQWRARPAASRRVAAALGFREIGGQLSVRLGLDQDAWRRSGK
ncbi:Protein N-acetyltransferase, RimJ/RimL family [Streptomyces sp. 2224.1]|uniref:GNAT family N-acetyltransferase n=1 Tax=unclassified Streptomyces TaxID=2593676 RepID=UPI0008987ECA|nr:MULTISPECIES: GNAT family N-acetyltransferase [unclassified Streptomyces]SED80084.1 Protein N-acetyltransferase, RimJ/RimL family [Streptomyces sp. 2112.3]SEE00091.1 Protein N-acetyltransferase, RimJ/RimL family [Streptomyces sp. 2224.1]